METVIFISKMKGVKGFCVFFPVGNVFKRIKDLMILFCFDCWFLPDRILGI